MKNPNSSSCQKTGEKALISILVVEMKKSDTPRRHLTSTSKRTGGWSEERVVIVTMFRKSEKTIGKDEVYR
jgi:hypothetical protein